MRTPTLETERLILRPIAVADAEEIYTNWTSDPDVAKYMTWNTYPSVEVTVAWLTEAAVSITIQSMLAWDPDITS